MGVEVVHHRASSWLWALACWWLIRLFAGLARGRLGLTSSAAPHDAARTMPSHLERHYGVHVGRLELEPDDGSSPLPPVPVPAPPLAPPAGAQAGTEHGQGHDSWTQHRRAWLAPLSIWPHAPARHPSAAAEAAAPTGAKAGMARSGTKRVVLFLPGGGFVAPMSGFHWKFVCRLSRALDALVVVQSYTLLPWGGIWDVIPPLLVVYRELQKAAEDLGVEFIVLGDSAGGSLAAALTLAARDAGLPPPGQLVLVSPGLEGNVSVPAAVEAEKQCAMLTARAMVVSRRRWAQVGVGRGDAEAFVHDMAHGEPGAPTHDEEVATAHPYASPVHGDWTWLTERPARPGGQRHKTRLVLISGTWDLSYRLSFVPFLRTLQSLGHDVDATAIIAPYAVHDYPIFVDTPLPLFVGAQQGLDLLVSSILARGD